MERRLCCFCLLLVLLVFLPSCSRRQAESSPTEGKNEVQGESSAVLAQPESDFSPEDRTYPEGTVFFSELPVSERQGMVKIDEASTWLSEDDVLPDDVKAGAVQLAQQLADEYMSSGKWKSGFFSEVRVERFSESAFVSSVEFYFEPTDYNDPYWWAGSVPAVGTGTMEGHLSKCMVLLGQKVEDSWEQVDALDF